MAHIMKCRNLSYALFATYRCAQLKPVVEIRSLSTVISESSGNVTLIGINRPNKRNCVNLETAKQLAEAFEKFETDSNAKVAVLHGIGGHFSAGLDLQQVSQLRSEAEWPEPSTGQGPMGPSRTMFKKPVIAAVAGYAVAGGLEIALMCDMRIFEETTVVGIFCRRFGVPLVDGGTVRLPQLIGLSRALDLILTGRPVKAGEALQFGLANRVVPTGTALAEAVKLAESLCKYPQECMLMDRKSAYHSTFVSASYTQAFRFEWENAKHVVGQESVKGAASFTKGEGRHGSFDTDVKRH